MQSCNHALIHRRKICAILHVHARLCIEIIIFSSCWWNLLADVFFYIKDLVNVRGHPAQGGDVKPAICKLTPKQSYEWRLLGLEAMRDLKISYHRPDCNPSLAAEGFNAKLSLPNCKGRIICTIFSTSKKGFMHESGYLAVQNSSIGDLVTH